MGNIKAIVYASATGHTRQYAELLGQLAGLPAYPLNEAKGRLPAGAPVIFLGWLMAGRVQGLANARKQYSVAAVCGVGLRRGAAQLEELRRANPMPEGVPVFALQGGYAPDKLHGLNKLLLSMVRSQTIRDLSAKDARTTEEEDLLDLFTRGGSRVSEKELGPVVDWIREKGGVTES